MERFLNFLIFLFIYLYVLSNLYKAFDFLIYHFRHDRPKLPVLKKIVFIITVIWFK